MRKINFIDWRARFNSLRTKSDKLSTCKRVKAPISLQRNGNATAGIMSYSGDLRWGPLSISHVGKQVVFGLIIGTIAGLSDNKGYYKFTMFLLVVVALLTVLDYLGVDRVNAPWGYRGPGSPAQFRNLDAERAFFLVIDLPVQNFGFVLGLLLAYGMLTGHLEFSSSGPHWH